MFKNLHYRKYADLPLDLYKNRRTQYPPRIYSIPSEASEMEREVQLEHLPVFVSSPLLSSANEGDFNY